jgi:hypothetical protein
MSSSLLWSDKAGVCALPAPPKSTVVAPRLVVEGAGGGLVSAGDGVMNPGVVVVDAGCRCVSVVAAAAKEVAIYDKSGSTTLLRNWRLPSPSD